MTGLRRADWRRCCYTTRLLSLGVYPKAAVTIAEMVAKTTSEVKIVTSNLTTPIPLFCRQSALNVDHIINTGRKEDSAYACVS